MAVTMLDVARLAGVSQRTVSNVVNNYAHVRPETRARVQHAILSLRYRPNVSAQSLRSGHTGLIALALPEIASSYFAELAEELQRCARQREVTLLMDHTGGNRDHELLSLEGYRSGLIDGLILNPLAITAQDLTASDLGIPIVLLGERMDDSGFLHVAIDNVAAASTATKHLLARGHQRIGVLGAPERDQGMTASGPAARRLQGYYEAMSASGVPASPTFILRTSDWTRASGYTLTREVMTRPLVPDALFCFNDALAVGALKALNELDLRVPTDVAVLGWDNVVEAAFTIPTLTSIAPDKAALAEAAINGVLDQIDGREPEPREHRVPYMLVIRDST